MCVTRWVVLDFLRSYPALLTLWPSEAGGGGGYLFIHFTGLGHGWQTVSVCVKWITTEWTFINNPHRSRRVFLSLRSIRRARKEQLNILFFSLIKIKEKRRVGNKNVCMAFKVSSAQIDILTSWLTKHFEV